jgi:hypothetical protein
LFAAPLVCVADVHPASQQAVVRFTIGDSVLVTVRFAAQEATP